MLTFDESKFPGESAFLIAAVLDRFLGLMAPLNSFSQVTAKALERERPIEKWPARSGMEVLADLPDGPAPAEDGREDIHRRMRFHPPRRMGRN